MFYLVVKKKNSPEWWNFFKYGKESLTCAAAKANRGNTVNLNKLWDRSVCIVVPRVVNFLFLIY